MQSRKRIKKWMLLLIIMVLLTGCSKTPSPILEELKEAVQEVEERSSALLEDLKEGLRSFAESIPGALSPYGGEPEFPESGEESWESRQYANGKIERAFLALPALYSYTFDEAAEEELLNLLNNYRLEQGLRPLAFREDLWQSARYKSLAMLQYNYFSHDNPNLSDAPFDELLWQYLGLSYSGVGENLAFVSISSPRLTLEAVELFTGWQNSPGHNMQMLSSVHEFVGIGVVRSSRGGSYFKGHQVLLGTQHFGS